MNNFSTNKFQQSRTSINATVFKLTRLFTIIAIAFSLAACGGGSGTDGTTPTDTNGGGTDQTITLSGTLSDTFSKPGGSSGRLLAVGDWIGALIEIIDLSGNVVVTTTADGNGSFSIDVPAGGPYFIRATIGNLVLTAYAPSSDTDQTISVDPQSTAIVNVLGAMAGVGNLGEAGVDASGSLPADIDAKISSIEDSPLLDDIADAIEQDIADNYDADATEPAVGGGGTAGDDLTVIIVAAQSDKTAPTTNAASVGGTYDSAQSVTLTCDDGAASDCYATYYATDGSDPTTGSPVYSTPISISSNTTLKFFSIDNAGNSESVNTEAYVIEIPTPTYTVTASADSNGSISPSGAVTVNEGDDQFFTITPDAGYSVADVSVDGASEGAITAYTFTNVTANHTISATFELIPPNTYTVGGNVSGLTGTGLVLQNNGGDDLTIASNDNFTFTEQADGSTYFVAVSTQPSGQACSVTNGSGTIAGANVPNISVECVTGDPWTTKSPMPTARGESPTSSVVNGKIYVIGGAYSNTVEEYDPATDTWSTKTSMPTARGGLTSGTVNGKIYAIGGGWYDSPLNTVEEYDPATDTWSTKTSMPTARFLLTSGVVNGKIYVIGGAYSNTVEEYDPATDTWATKTAMPTERWSLTSSVVNGKIYVIGGYSDDDLNTVEEYDPATDTWTTKTSTPTAREGLTSGTVNGKIYAIGGMWGDFNISGTVEEYDPATDTWTTKTAMPIARSFLTSSVVNEKIYVIGGGYLNTVEEYYPLFDQ